jgi:hypothetical protein
MVRARRREHLENLKRACVSLAGCEIVESATTDYAFRIIATKTAFAEAMYDLALEIAWQNVKGEAERNVDLVGADFVDALHTTWAAFNRIQQRS